jgi:hypothetical protein
VRPAGWSRPALAERFDAATFRGCASFRTMMFLLLIDGAIVSTLREPGPAAALRAKRIAATLPAAQS